MEINEISAKIIGAAIEVHRRLGPGLLESTYQSCLVYELRNMGIQFEEQVPLPLVYKDIFLEAGYRIDLLVEKKIVVELKSVENLNEVHLAQALTYLKLSDAIIALLINFNVVKLKDGLRRFIASR